MPYYKWTAIRVHDMVPNYVVNRNSSLDPFKYTDGVLEAEDKRSVYVMIEAHGMSPRSIDEIEYEKYLEMRSSRDRIQKLQEIAESRKNKMHRKQIHKDNIRDTIITIIFVSLAIVGVWTLASQVIRYFQ